MGTPVRMEPPLKYGPPSVWALTPEGRTPLGGQFDWGGRLQKRNGGSSRCPHADRQPASECNGIRALDWETYTSIRLETRA